MPITACYSTNSSVMVSRVNLCIGLRLLYDRCQAVVVDGPRSSFVSVRSGDPRGSALGPCLFLAYINDISEKLTARARLSADDTPACRMIFSNHDQYQLRQDLHHLADWEKSWDMEFHPAKCQTLPVTGSRSLQRHSYELHGHVLDTVPSAKYLGITIHRELN